jgi:hypothetical protein
VPRYSETTYEVHWLDGSNDPQYFDGADAKAIALRTAREAKANGDEVEVIKSVQTWVDKAAAGSLAPIDTKESIVRFSLDAATRQEIYTKAQNMKIGTKAAFSGGDWYTVAAHVGNNPAGERTFKDLDEAKAHAKVMLAAVKTTARGQAVVVDVYPVVNYSPQSSVLTLRASRVGAKAAFDRRIELDHWTSPKGTRYIAGIHVSGDGLGFHPFVTATYADGGDQLMSGNAPSFKSEKGARKWLANYLAQSYSRTGTFSRVGAKAAFAKWEETQTKKHGEPITEYTAKIGRDLWKIDTMPSVGDNYGALFRWDDLRGLRQISAGPIADLKRQAEEISRRGNDAIGNLLRGFSRAGAKAAFAHPTLDEVLRIAKQMTAQGNEAAAKTLIESWFREHGKDGTQSKSSRTGAKAKFGVMQVLRDKQKRWEKEAQLAESFGNEDAQAFSESMADAYEEGANAIKTMPIEKAVATIRSLRSEAASEILQVLRASFSRPAKSTHAADDVEQAYLRDIAELKGWIEKAYGGLRGSHANQLKARLEEVERDLAEYRRQRGKSTHAAPKFKIGDKVAVTHSSLVGTIVGFEPASELGNVQSRGKYDNLENKYHLKDDNGQSLNWHSEGRLVRASRSSAKATHATDNMYYTVAAHIGDQPAGERTTKSLDEAKAYAKAMLAALKPNAKGKPLVVDVYPVVNYSPQASVLSLKASRTSADSNRLTLAQRIAVEHDAKRMANR